nr:unnamed protein product [Callosobruchus chinensis]
MWLLCRRIKRRKIKRKYWIHPINQSREYNETFHTLFQELRCDESKFFNFFRMSVASFDELHGKLISKIQRQNSKMRS